MYKYRHDQMQPFERCQKNLKNALENIQIKKGKSAKVFQTSIFMCKLLVSGNLKITYLLEKGSRKIHHHLPNLHDFGFRSDTGLRSPWSVAVAPPTRQISNCDATWETRHFTWQLVQAPGPGGPGGDFPQPWKGSEILGILRMKIYHHPQVVE